MKRLFQTFLIFLCVFGTITGLVSASSVSNRTSINSSADATANPVTNDAIEVINANLAQKISSGQIQKFISSYSYGDEAKLTIGPLLPLYTLYNTAKGPEYCDELNVNDFSFQSGISEYGVFIYPEGNKEPILFYTFHYKENAWRVSSMCTTAENSGFGQNISQYEQYAVSRECSSPVVIWLFNDFALVFDMDGKQVVLPSTKMQHLLGIPDPNQQPQICTVDDFIKRANEAIIRFQNEKKSGQISVG